MTKTHVSADLLAYLDDGLTAAERARVEAHLATCAACREELASLRALRAGLAAAFDAALTPVRLPRAAEERIRGVLRERAARPRWWWALRLNWGLAAQAAPALLVLLFSLNLAPLLTAPPPVAAQETLVLGQNRWRRRRCLHRARRPRRRGRAPHRNHFHSRQRDARSPHHRGARLPRAAHAG